MLYINKHTIYCFQWAMVPYLQAARQCSVLLWMSTLIQRKLSSVLQPADFSQQGDMGSIEHRRVKWDYLFLW